jgi:chromosomal replication initiator protein
VVEDHSASAEFTEVEYTGDGRQDLRPEPAVDFRSEIPPAPEPAPRTDPADHLSPSLPIPLPEPPESGYRPRYEGYGYRSELERAATDLPTGPLPSPEPPAGTAYFGAAPVVGNLRYSGETSNTWTGARGPAEPQGNDRPVYGDGAGPVRNEGDGRANNESGAAEVRVAEPQIGGPRVAEPRAEGPGPVTDLGDAWTRVLAGLPPNQRAWLTNSRPVTLHESTAIVAVPDDFTRGQLETRLRPDLERILSESFGRDIRIAVTVDPSLDPELREPQAPPQPVVREPLRTDGAYQPTIQSALSDPDHNAPQFSPPQRQEPAPQHYEQPRPAPQQQPFGHQFGSVAPPPNGMPQPATEAQGEARLNPKYTFETFVIGSSNRFAHAAAVAVAEAPGKAYNPQLIYGDSGLGKTHLLHAIGHYVRSLYTGARVRYVSSEEFTNDFINAIRDDKASQFQRRYRDVDVLLIDDIQFLEGKIQTQEEFFHTFNTLHNANKQIVISSDRAPKRLEALEDRLRNRFEWGLITDIQPPDLETRIAILRKKAATERLTAPPEVLEFIASKVQTNIRELEGALIRVTAFASLNRQPVDLSLAEIVLKDLIPEGSKPEVTASMIMGQTASYFGLSIDDLCGSSRSRVLVTARQIAMYLCRELTDLSLPKIGQQFGGRDHTTVMHAERKIRQLMSERRSVFNQVTELTNRIKHQAKQQ